MLDLKFSRRALPTFAMGRPTSRKHRPLSPLAHGRTWASLQCKLPFISEMKRRELSCLKPCFDFDCRYGYSVEIPIESGAEHPPIRG